jgi:hypothetical protein
MTTDRPFGVDEAAHRIAPITTSSTSAAAIMAMRLGSLLASVFTFEGLASIPALSAAVSEIVSALNESRSPQESIETPHTVGRYLTPKALWPQLR